MQHPQRIAIASLVFSFLTMTISIILPELFSSMAVMASARFEYLGRGYGLFLQPNLYAYNSVMIMILIYLMLPMAYTSKYALIIALFVVGLFLSGSRGGMLAASVLVIGPVIVDRHLVSRRFISSIPILILIATVLVFLVILFEIGESVYWQYYIGRFLTIFDNDIIQDGSVSARFYYQAAFLDSIIEKPLFGYGIGSSSYLIESGELLGAAHNQILDTLLQYGFVGLITVLFCAYGFYQSLLIKIGKNYRLKVLLIMSVILVSMLGTNMIFQIQNFYILLGYVFSRLPVQHLVRIPDPNLNS
jgi:O-antigen ligase